MFRKRIGITQKTMCHPKYDEVLDCLDTRWTPLLVSLEMLPVPLPNLDPSDVKQQLQILQLDGLIFSGGNTLLSFADETDDPAKLSAQRDNYEMSLLNEAIRAGIPVLGVCRGLQLINVFYGGSLVKIKGHAGNGNHPLVGSNADVMFDCPARVNSYHDCGVLYNQLGKDLTPLAYDTDGLVEAFRHLYDKVLAIMWHPEREKPYLKCDRILIEKYFEE